MVALRPLVVSVGLGLLCACAREQRWPMLRNGLRSDVVGCYALYAGRRRVDTSLYNASPSVQLDSTLLERMSNDTIPGVFRSMTPLREPRTPASSARQGRVAPRWAADSLTDTIRLSFVNGFSGAVLVLSAPRGRTDTLVGRLYESWDFGPPFETTHGPARAIRQSCSH